MAIDLTKPLSWKKAAGDNATLLDELQPNILKGHVREALTLLFLKFDDAAKAKKLLKSLASPSGGKPALMKSAHTHLKEVETFARTEQPGTPYIGVGLTAKGYDAIGLTAKSPSDQAFRDGMQQAQLNDPAPQTWDKAFAKPADLHAVVLVADADQKSHDAALAAVRALLAKAGGVTVLGDEQPGKGLRNKNGDGIEHFGYVDGRSQPLFLTEDIQAERDKRDGIASWDPTFGIGRVIVSDPAAPDPTKHFGSYFIFRKLEQNVRLFKREEKALAARLGLEDDDIERAGAMIVGRFEDGTPLTLQQGDGMHKPVPNNFNYESDRLGQKCPFFAHIRKVNPRGTGGVSGQTPAAERAHIMARRGQTYGERSDEPNDGLTRNKPTKDVGLLFMAFNVSIADQFVFTQRSWANAQNFPVAMIPDGAGGFKPATPKDRLPAGLDMVIAQSPVDAKGNETARPDIFCPLSWGAEPVTPDDNKVTTALPRAVTMRGGEYFFMPSLAFLRSL